MLKEFLTPQVAESLLALVSTGVVFLLGKFTHFLAARTRSQYVSSLLIRADQTVRSVADALTQEMGAALRAKAEGGQGKLSDSDASYLRDLAITRARAMLGKAAVAELAKVTGDVDNLLETYLEAAIAETKRWSKSGLTEAKLVGSGT